MTAAAAPKASGKLNLIVTIVALTILAVVGGGLVGKLLSAKLQAASAPAAVEAMKPIPYAGNVEVRELPALVTNLANPADMRIRLQVSIVFPKASVETPEVLMAQINDDIVAFLKTLSLEQIQGASGLQALREDLNERAVVRSQGKVREVIIETLVVQ